MIFEGPTMTKLSTSPIKPWLRKGNVPKCQLPKQRLISLDFKLNLPNLANIE